MITKFKLFENDEFDPNDPYNEEVWDDAAFHKMENPNSWKGVPFWIGVADKSDGEILKTWTYDIARMKDFHHQWYMDERFLDEIENGKLFIFWGNAPGDIELDWNFEWEKEEYDMLVTKILKQLDDN